MIGDVFVMSHDVVSTEVCACVTLISQEKG